MPALLEEAAAPDDAWQARLLTSIACRGAIRRGQPLETREMEALLRELAGGADPQVRAGPLGPAGGT